VRWQNLKKKFVDAGPRDMSRRVAFKFEYSTQPNGRKLLHSGIFKKEGVMCTPVGYAVAFTLLVAMGSVVRCCHPMFCCFLSERISELSINSEG
jgi:hypothetical protein